MSGRFKTLVLLIIYFVFILWYCFVLPMYVEKYITYLNNNGQSLHGTMTGIMYILVMILIFGYGMKSNSK